MLPPAALDLADRLATALMALARAVGAVAITGSTPTLAEDAARTLLFRLTNLIVSLIHISNFGVRARAKPAAAAATPASAPAAPPARPPPAPSLPRRKGWLLAALPDIAPIVAADLRALLDDPAIATLLDAAPALHRTLRPILRGLGLAAAAPPTPSPDAPPPPPEPRPAPPPNPPPKQTRTPRSPPPRQNRPSQTARLITPESLRYRNNIDAP